MRGGVEERRRDDNNDKVIVDDDDSVIKNDPVSVCRCVSEETEEEEI